MTGPSTERPSQGPRFLGIPLTEGRRRGLTQRYRVRLHPHSVDATTQAAKALQNSGLGAFTIKRSQPTGDGPTMYELATSDLPLFSAVVGTAIKAARATGQRPGESLYQTALTQSINNSVREHLERRNTTVDTDVMAERVRLRRRPFSEDE